MLRNESLKPLITVYMPTYNRVELLKRAVDSVLGQNYKNIELIVVDDCSTDLTHKYLSEKSRNDPRLRYFINEENSGACFSRNVAIFQAKGLYITGLDDDDYFLPNHLKTLIDKWRNKPQDCVALYSNAYLKEKDSIKKMQKRLYSCNASDLICNNHIGNQIFTKTEYLQSIRGFDTSLVAWQDLECWYRLLTTYKSKAYSTNKYSYIVDISHPHERITTSKKESVNQAFEYFQDKHKLSENEIEVLKIQTSSYTGNRPNIESLIRRIIYKPRIRYIRAFLLLPLRSSKLFKSKNR